MLITPLPGISRDNILKTLREQCNALTGLSHSGDAAYAHLTAYVEWVANAVHHLEKMISSADLDRLVLTRGYERLMSAAGTLMSQGADTQKALSDLVDLEVRQRLFAFEDARSALDEQIERWSMPGAFLVFDTSVFIKHEKKLKDMDHSLFLPQGQRFQPVHLLVPIVVVDELDGLKNKGDKWTRWRAGYTLAVFDELFPNGTGPGVLRPAEAGPQPDPSPRFEFSAEIVLDPPGHVRLPINDDELVDRTLAIQSLAGRGVTLVTFDTGQSMRARGSGLIANKLTKPIGEEPPRPEGRATEKRP